MKRKDFVISVIELGCNLIAQGLIFKTTDKDVEKYLDYIFKK